MFGLSLLPVILREKIATRSLPREPEPDLVMNGEEETAAYASAGRDDKDFAAVNLFHLANICQVIEGRLTVVDLGCGPATLLVEIAKLNPTVQFIGVDLSDNMIRIARSRILAEGLDNVTIKKGDITSLDFIAPQSIGAVISTVALHHLPSLVELRKCFAEVARILEPAGAIYIADFARFKLLKTVIYFAYLNAKNQPAAAHPYYLDYERSMRAAFLHEDFVNLCAELLPRQSRVYTTSPIAFLTIVCSGPDSPLPAQTLKTIQVRRTALPRQSQRRLATLLSHFRAGGLPFKSIQ